MRLNVAILAFCLGVAVAFGAAIVGLSIIEPTPPPEVALHHG